MIRQGLASEVVPVGVVWRRRRQGRVQSRLPQPPSAVGLVQRGGEVRERRRQLDEHVRRQSGDHRGR